MVTSNEPHQPHLASHLEASVQLAASCTHLFGPSAKDNASLMSRDGFKINQRCLRMHTPHTVAHRYT